jgi:hypothetical protein
MCDVSVLDIPILYYTQLVGTTEPFEADYFDNLFDFLHQSRLNCTEVQEIDHKKHWDPYREYQQRFPSNTNEYTWHNAKARKMTIPVSLFETKYFFPTIWKIYDHCIVLATRSYNVSTTTYTTVEN